MSFAPRLVVDPIARQPLPFGLFSVLVPRSSTDPHWQNGIEWESLTCEPASGIGDVNCDSPTTGIGLPKNFAGQGELGEADPFTIYGSYECSSVGHTLQYAQDRATEHLLAREEAAVEHAIWTGDLFGNDPEDQKGFADGAEAALVAAVSIRFGFAALEGWIAENYGSLGVIHVSRPLALLAIAHDVVTSKGNGLFTELGTPVIAGAGYPGTGPNGEAPTPAVQYAYATPALVGYRSEIFTGADPVSAGLDRGTNDMQAVSERTYTVGWDPCGTAYVTIDLEA